MPREILSTGPIFRILCAGTLLTLTVSGCSAPERGASGPELLEYEIRIERDGEVVHTPSLVIEPGATASIEIGEDPGDCYAVKILPSGQVHVAAVLHGANGVIGRPELIVEVDEPAEITIDDGEERYTLAVTATCRAVT